MVRHAGGSRHWRGRPSPPLRATANRRNARGKLRMPWRLRRWGDLGLWRVRARQTEPGQWRLERDGGSRRSMTTRGARRERRGRDSKRSVLHVGHFGSGNIDGRVEDRVVDTKSRRRAAGGGLHGLRRDAVARRRERVTMFWTQERLSRDPSIPRYCKLRRPRRESRRDGGRGLEDVSPAMPGSVSHSATQPNPRLGEERRTVSGRTVARCTSRVGTAEASPQRGLVQLCRLRIQDATTLYRVHSAHPNHLPHPLEQASESLVSRASTCRRLRLLDRLVRGRAALDPDDNRIWGRDWRLWEACNSQPHPRLPRRRPPPPCHLPFAACLAAHPMLCNTRRIPRHGSDLSCRSRRPRLGLAPHPGAVIPLAARDPAGQPRPINRGPERGGRLCLAPLCLRMSRNLQEAPAAVLPTRAVLCHRRLPTPIADRPQPLAPDPPQPVLVLPRPATRCHHAQA